MRSPANIAQAIKYEKWGGKSSLKEEESDGRKACVRCRST
jgi:hypothetical protein